MIVNRSYQEGKQWEKGDKLGEGSAGVVFKGTDSTTKHEFVVKKVSQIADATNSLCSSVSGFLNTNGWRPSNSEHDSGDSGQKRQ